MSRPPSPARSMTGGRNPWAIAVVVSIATFMEVLDTAIANVSLRHIAGAMAAGYDESTWILTSYLISNAIILPISGWLATTIGRKRFYMICVALFTASSLLCALAPSLMLLITFRVLQGLGGGGLAPSEQAILADIFPPEKHGPAFALYGITVVVAPALGPTLGGWITDTYSWRWIFLINVPVGALSLGLTGLLLHDPQGAARRRPRVDVLGFGLVTLGLGCLEVVLDKGQREDWFASNFIVWFSVIAAVALLALVIRELTHPDPVVDLPLLRDRSFAVCNVVMFATGFLLYSTTQFLPQLLQTSLGYTALDAGLVLTPGGLATMAMMPVAGTLTRRVPPGLLMAAGMAVEAAALWHMSGFDPQISYAHAAWARVYQGLGLPLLFVPITSTAYAGLPPGKSNNASALINLARNVGGSAGISLSQTVLAQRAQFHQARLVGRLTPLEPAYRHALAAFAQQLGGGPQGRARALAHLGSVLHRQAEMLAYIDIFRLLMLAAVVIAPLALLLRRRAGPPP